MDDERKIKDFIEDTFIPRGTKCGEKIAQVLRERGHKTVIPLYRSAVVIEVKENDSTPYISVRSFDDPHWRGAEEISDKTVANEGHEYIITGSRSGINFYDALEQEVYGEGKMTTKRIHKSLREIKEETGD